MTLKFRLVLSVVILIPQTVMLGLAYNSSLIFDKNFNQAEALSLASALLIALALPGFIIEWLVGKPLGVIRHFCLQIKQGHYHQRLVLPNEGREGEDEDEISGLMRNMNWMARQIEMREKDLCRTLENLQSSRQYIDKQNKHLLQVNRKLLQTQQGLQKQAIELKKAYQQMQTMAMTDALTGLANRRHFFDSLNQHFQMLMCLGQPLSLLMLDIDHFKNVNDSYGHEIGDRVLHETADIIRDNIRNADVPARVGGEEYAVLLTDTESPEAISVAYRIKKAVAEHAFLAEDQRQFFVTISVGVCTLSRVPGCARNCLYTYADRALYFSKNHGRNSISVFNPFTGSIDKADCA